MVWLPMSFLSSCHTAGDDPHSWKVLQAEHGSAEHGRGWYRTGTGIVECAGKPYRVRAVIYGNSGSWEEGVIQRGAGELKRVNEKRGKIEPVNLICRSVEHIKTLSAATNFKCCYGGYVIM